MGKQLTIQFEPRHDLTYEEWRSFVEGKHGKYRGANTDEAIAALRSHIDGERNGDRCSDSTPPDGLDRDLFEKLLGEIRALRRENERLRERLDAAMDANHHGGTPASRGGQTNNAAVSIAGDSADSKTRPTTAAGDEWSWDEYDPDTFEGTIPEAALRSIHESFDPVGQKPSAFDGRELPAIARDHVELPGEPADARVAIVAAILKHEHETLVLGGIIAHTMKLLDNDTKGYVQRKLVEGRNDAPNEHAVLDWLAGPHPDPSREEWVTQLSAYEELREEVGEQALSEAEDIARMFVGAALGYPQHMAAGPAGSATVDGMSAEFEEYRDRLAELDVFPGVAGKVIKRALSQLEPGDISSGRLERVPTAESWESFWRDWPTDSASLVAWWEEKRDATLDEEIRERTIAALDEVAPNDEPQKPDNWRTKDGEDGEESAEEGGPDETKETVADETSNQMARLADATPEDEAM